jgi:hypothetical protein
VDKDEKDVDKGETMTMMMTQVRWKCVWGRECR